MAESNQDRRETYRFPVRESAQTGTLKDESQRIDVELLNVSSGGFGVRTEADLPIEIGKEFRLEANTGKHDVVVAHTKALDEGHELGLRRLRDLHDEQLPNRKKGSRPARFLKSLRNGDHALLGGLLTVGLLVFSLIMVVKVWNTLVVPGKPSNSDFSRIGKGQQSSQRSGRGNGQSVVPKRVADDSIQEFMWSFAGEFVITPITGPSDRNE